MSQVEEKLGMIEFPEIPEDVLPQAILYRIIVAPARAKKMSDGGIALPDEAQRNDQLLKPVGKVVSMGPLAFMGKLPHSDLPMSIGGKPPVAVGDYVVFGSYAGQRIILSTGDEVRIMDDDNILATAKRPEALLGYI